MRKVLASVMFVMVLGLYVGLGTSQEATEATPEKAAVVHGPGFVDTDGDGYNDRAPDHDGDGIPNGQDQDWIKGQKNGKGPGWGNKGQKGDCDGTGKQIRQRQKAGKGKMAQGNQGQGSDHDGDGIPNGQDKDFVRGSGMGHNAGNGPNFIDQDKDGVCDRAQSNRSSGAKKSN